MIFAPLLKFPPNRVFWFPRTPYGMPWLPSDGSV